MIISVLRVHVTHHEIGKVVRFPTEYLLRSASLFVIKYKLMSWNLIAYPKLFVTQKRQVIHFSVDFLESEMSTRWIDGCK